MAFKDVNTGITGGVNIKPTQNTSTKPSTTALQTALNSALQAANNQFPDANSQAMFEAVQPPTGRAPIFPVSSELQAAYSTQTKAENNPDYAAALANPVAAITGQLTGTATGSSINTNATSGSDGGNVTVPVDYGADYAGNGQTVAMPNYLWADLAKVYGMDAATAYQEALSNTSYQRAVSDLRAAGLNPLLAVNGLSGAGGVYSAQAAGSGVSSGASSARGAHQWFNIFSNLGTAIGGLTGHNYVSAQAGKAIGSVIGNFLDGQYKF